MVVTAAYHIEDQSGPGTRTTNPCGRVITRHFRKPSAPAFSHGVLMAHMPQYCVQLMHPFSR
jgi:hypothetical protein